MMQYVQWNEQPSCTFTNARVRSTDALSSAMPSMGLAASTPESVGSAAASGSCGAESSWWPSASSASSSARKPAFASLSTR